MRWLGQFEVEIPDQFLGMRPCTEIGERPRSKNYKPTDFVFGQLLKHDIGKNISFADRVGERLQRTCEVRLLFTNLRFLITLHLEKGSVASDRPLGVSPWA